MVHPRLVHGVVHVHRKPDGATVVRDTARDGLADPPGGHGREAIPARVVEPSPTTQMH